MAHNPLFHGTNEEYWDDFANTIYIPHYWTDSPLESMDHSANSVRNQGSKMLVICIPEWDEEHFELYPMQMAYAPETHAKWYVVKKISME